MEKIKDLSPERMEVTADRLLLYAADGDEFLARVHAGGTRADHRAGPQVHPRRRLPAPDRPDPDRLMSGDPCAGQRPAAPLGSRGRTLARDSARRLSVRAFRCWLLMYRRTWRSSVWSSVFGPLFYLGAMGYGLGSLVDKNGTASLGGVPYVVFVAPAVLAVQAMNSGLSNALFPVFGGIHWNRIYIAARATMLRPADIYRGHLLFITMRIAMNSACFVVLMAAFGLIRSRVGGAAAARRGAARLRVRHPVRRVGGHAGEPDRR